MTARLVYLTRIDQRRAVYRGLFTLCGWLLIAGMTIGALIEFGGN